MRITLPVPKRFLKMFESVTNTALINTVTGISTDSRECMDGDLYIAIEGVNVDGHQYIADAHRNGAVAALVAKPGPALDSLQQINVDDPVQITGKIANSWRSQFNLPVIGITGSNGKTTTKDLIKHILGSKYDVHFTKGNFNTSIGVPLTLLQLQDKHDISVIEMGANQPGDIRTLSQIVAPTDGLITNIAPAHLEGFGTIENVAEEKAELFSYLQTGHAFRNISDDWIKSFTTNARHVTYGCVAECDFSADYYRESDDNIILIINTEEINTKSNNKVLAKNVLAASAVAHSFDIGWDTIRDRVISFNPSYGRSVITRNNNITIIDDTYNANYESTAAAIENLAQLSTKGRRILVFGDMAELGDQSKKYHEKIGQKCVQHALDAVFTVGTDTVITDKMLNSITYHRHYESREQLSEELKNYVKSRDIILFKGSRSMEIEKVIHKVFRN